MLDSRASRSLPEVDGIKARRGANDELNDTQQTVSQEVGARKKNGEETSVVLHRLSAEEQKQDAKRKADKQPKKKVV